VVKTDHRTLESWVTEHIDTPSGPRGRRARWHETLSQFNLSVEYVPGKDNVVADALSRFAYPASSSREDVSLHGSAAAEAEVRKLVEQEIREGKMVGCVKLGKQFTQGNTESGFTQKQIQGQLLIFDPEPTENPLASYVSVITRSGGGKAETESEQSALSENLDSQPIAKRTRRRARSYPPHSRRSTRGRRKIKKHRYEGSESDFSEPHH